MQVHVVGSYNIYIYPGIGTQHLLILLSLVHFVSISLIMLDIFNQHQTIINNFKNQQFYHTTCIHNLFHQSTCTLVVKHHKYQNNA